MNNYSFFVEGKEYIFNLKKIFDLVMYSEKHVHNEQEISDQYEIDEDNNLSVTGKIVREIKTNSDTNTDNIRYDFVKLLIMNVLAIESDEDVTFGDRMCLNTLISEGLVSEVNVSE